VEAAKVSQSDMSPRESPRSNHRSRCADVPWRMLYTALLAGRT